MKKTLLMLFFILNQALNFKALSQIRFCKKFLGSLFFCLFFIATNASAKIVIFACEPEWGEVARLIVKDKAEVRVGTTSDQNPRDVGIKSTLIAASRSASIVFCSGGDLESSWLPATINKGNNLKAITDDNGLLFAIDYVKSPKFFDKNALVLVGRKEYLINGSRVHLNPHNITKIAGEFTRRMKLIDSINSNFYQKSYDSFLPKWQEAIEKWEERASILKGMPLLANDNSWNYLADWLGLKITTIYDANTREKPNLVYLHDLAKKLKANPVEAIIFARFEDKRFVLWLREETKTRLIGLPYSIGSSSNNSDFFKLFNSIINGLLTDCSSGVCKTLDETKKTKVKFL
jgi:zinc/manganese transport system substrate-binding protein